MLNYTGHPLLDVGIATIVAFADKDQPDELVEADLDKIAAFMAEQYVKNPLRGFLTVASSQFRLYATGLLQPAGQTANLHRSRPLRLPTGQAAAC
ncbi:MAG: hypothetical protein IPJ94_12555 [Chloroflexi bacterium]|nr:hypothetical protein [Chloroflexota bacterium]